ncbi:substrate-binding periplasmic protein [Pseudomonas sp. Gutcm_11s]|uniref:substrate-binding periplasmic protein n=1 Tax=Pseudomonas sp. Gutcm_11s TaxID=3026088 RepID=UPI0023611F71|nr:ABC transporter substrate-binding protein [Pseudomonas sp. Gutcm_11s]MDD0845217.1 ABC transporter substrate-binding protein [Pseudomonas sp. Gutcm_11s]
MRITRWLGCLFALCLAATSRAESLQLYTEEYPPLNFARDGRPVGLAVDLVRELFERTGDHGVISVVPWARGYQAAQDEPNTALFVTMRTPEREQRFKWVGPLAMAITSFYALKGSGIRIGSLEEAAQVGTIAVPRQWYSYQALQGQGLPNLYGVIGPQQMMSMLRHGRVPVVVADNLTLESLLALGGLRPGSVEPLYGFLHSEAYIAFSPSTADAVVQNWQEALDSMKRDGSFALIYRRWLVEQEIPAGLLDSAAP